MPATPISGSPNITSLDSKIQVNLCTGNFLVDVTPSVFTEAGVSTSGGVQGASIQITNPVGVIIDPYPTSGFDIYPPMTSVYSFAIPQIAGVYQYGTYTITVRLTDEDGTNYYVTKSVNICPPDSKNKNRNYGCLEATITGNCETGKVIIMLNAPPNYKGTMFTSQVNDLTLEYPTESGLAPFETTFSSFSRQLYEGQYILTGTACVLYTYTDNIYYYINYKVKCEKIIRCIIDECCIQAKFVELRLQVNSDCTQAQKDATASIIVNALWLLESARLAAKCGDDPSDILGDLEALLGCKCTCNCNEGTPIIPQSAEQGFMYRGLLSQVGSSNPTAVVSDFNTVEIAWVRQSAGVYIGTLSGVFTPLTEDNTFIYHGTGLNALSPNTPFFIHAGYNAADSIIVVTTNAAGTAADTLMFELPLELSIL